MTINTNYWNLAEMLKSQMQAIHIEGCKQLGSTEEAVSLHYLPCKVECVCDGKEDARPCTHPAKVDTFFDPVMRKAEGGGAGGAAGGVGESYSATFRGRPLEGVLMKVPEGYTGKVLCESGRRTTDEV